MGLFREFRGHSSLENPSVSLADPVAYTLFGGEKTAGVVINEKTALGLTAVYRAISLTAGTVAMFPLEPFRLAADAGARADRLAATHRRSRHEELELRRLEQDLETHLRFSSRAHLPPGRAAERLTSGLLLDPAGADSDVTSFEFWETAVAHILLWGNSYSFKERNGLNEIKRLVQLDPSRMRVGRTKDRTKVFAYSLADGQVAAYTAREVMHVPALGTDGTVGISPIRTARTAVALGIALEKFGAQLFEKGTLPSGVLETDMKLEEEDAEALKKRWNQKMAGLDNAHDVAILDRGAKFHGMTIPPEDAQFIESRRFSVVEVARLFGVPPHLLMDQEKSSSWGTGLEVTVRAWITFGLGLMLTRVASRVSKELLPRGQVAEHDTSALMRGDSEARSRFYGMGIRDGWLKRSEVRRWEGLVVDDPVLDRYIDPTMSKPGDAGSGSKGSPKSADGSPSGGGTNNTLNAKDDDGK